MKKNIIKTGISMATLALPLIVFAQGKTLRDVIGTVIGYFQVFITLIIGLAVLTFIWNVYLYFFTEKPKAEAGKYVLFSTIGFFVILSFWGMVAILKNSLNLPDAQPQWPFGGGSLQQSQPNQFNTNQGYIPPTGFDGNYGNTDTERGGGGNIPAPAFDRNEGNIDSESRNFINLPPTTFDEGTGNEDSESF